MNQRKARMSNSLTVREQHSTWHNFTNTNRTTEATMMELRAQAIRAKHARENRAK